MAASSTFAARFDGRCGDCGGKIKVGDDVIFVAGSVEHADCDRSLDLKPAGAICPGCFLELPVSGVCSDCG